jgi:hypothetical protein
MVTYIKNMVCIRCRMAIKTWTENTGLVFTGVKTWEAGIMEKAVKGFK